MRKLLNIYNLIPKTIVFIGVPILLWYLGDFPRRSELKETISIITFVAFTLMIGQFFLTRGYRTIQKKLKMSNLLRIHKFIGYLSIPILIIHPFLVVLPRYFEGGVEPLEAFWTIITSFNSFGVILGLIAWTILLTIGITSLLRNKLSMNYKTWRTLHGILSMLLLTIATWHVINLGRHSNLAVSVYIIIIAVGGILLLLTHIFSIIPKTEL